MKTKVIQFGLIGVVMLLLLNGCKTVRGGGWINNWNGEKDGKSTFGINITCKNSEYTGHFTFHDHGDKFKGPDGKLRRVSLKARIVGALESGTSCEDANISLMGLGEHCTSYMFTYRAQPDKSGAEGSGAIDFCDARYSEDPDDKDELKIQIDSAPSGGPYAGYLNYGALGGGNLIISVEK